MGTRPAHEARIGGEGLQRFSRRAEKQVVDGLLVAIGDLAQLCRQGKGDQEVRYRQEQCLLLCQPRLCFVILALVAMTRPEGSRARVIAVDLSPQASH